MKNIIFALITEKEKRLPFYLCGCGFNYPQDHMKRPLGYPDYQWIQCDKGEGELILKGKKYKLTEGYGMFLYPEDPHEYYPIGVDFTVSFFSFNGYGVYDFLQNIGIYSSFLYKISHPEIILSKIEDMFNLYNSSLPLKELNLSSLIYNVLMDLYKFISFEKETSLLIKQGSLENVLKYIDENFNKVILLKDLSNIINVTPEHLCFLFKNILSLRPFEYINRVRVNKAKEYIAKNKDISVKELAIISGFSDTSYFCFIFKKYNGITLGEFKRII